ncbi:hypothetical protein DM01DRAFT_1346768 [Hesseltinella vesiculosa]|uniref:Pentacotripeptide-repeat region of PRORP domain-containing protein n=1 Tax=Hesseltinella vesiculosa TaxID=101127 RepID=A0A1X2GEL4_9FUNG|nr:hypothetical protein DM01DRAFT_1346768 [Hesseltinella vesiculosa]
MDKAPHDQKTTATKPSLSPQRVTESLDQYQAVGNIKGAIGLLRKAQHQNVATPAMYIQVINMLRECPFDVEASSLVAQWFYSPDTTLPDTIKKDLDVWKALLKLGFRFAGTYRKDDLNALMETFVATFDLASLSDQSCWELLIRGNGMLRHRSAVTEYFDALLDRSQHIKMDRSSILRSATLAYAATGSNAQASKLFDELDSNGKVTLVLLQQLIRIYGFQGNLYQTNKYLQLCKTRFPDSNNDTMALIAHRGALMNQFRLLVKTRGNQGLPLKSRHSPELDAIHASWQKWTDHIINDLPLDLTQCNVMLEYYTLANRIDPHGFPLEYAERLVDETMPKHNIVPNEKTWMTLLFGYATSHEYKKSSQRLDMALTVLSRMQQAGIQANQECFHALYQACLPYVYGKGFIFDHFQLASNLANAISSKTYLDHRPRLDRRMYELESIMLDSRIPHDRTTIKHMLTALGSAGRYRAMWKRWDLLKMSGIRRDMGMYQHIFALASLDPQQAEYALSVTRSELDREVDHRHDQIPRLTYVAMLDCAIASQDHRMASSIIQELRQHHLSSDVHSADVYVPILRAYTLLPSLTSQLPAVLDEIKQKNLPYNNLMWQYVMSYHLLHDDSGAAMTNLQHTFNSYTMDRFQQLGRIPIPVREAAPVVPFPSAPYSVGDMAMINMYVAGLLDAQDLSLVFDVLKALDEQTDKIGLSRGTMAGVVKLAKQENSTSELSWIAHHLLPKVSSQNANFRKWAKRLQENTPQ